MRFRDAPVTHGIAILTIAASALLILSGNNGLGTIVGGFIPSRMPGRELVVAGLFVPAWLTPLTATLIHGGWIHLLFNMVTLVFTGRAVEKALGPWSVVLLYLTGAYAAAAGQWAQSPVGNTPMIGASGAISAVVAAYAMLYGGGGRARPIGPIPAWLVHAVWLGIAWILINVMINYAMLMGQPVAIGAHIGGFIAGLILARPLLIWRYRRA